MRRHANRAGLLPLLASALALCALVVAPDGSSGPTAAQRDAIRAGVARKVLDGAVAEQIETSPRVRVVVVFAHDPSEAPALHTDAAARRLAPLGFTPVRRYDRIPVLAGYFNATALAALLDDPHVVRVGLDEVVRAQLAEAVPLVNLDELHQAGLTGAGARIAVLDSGVDLAHPDLAGAVIAQRCFCDDNDPGGAGCCPNGQSEQSGPGAAQDDQGHGTIVAGVLTSAGVHAPLGGAPDAQLVAVKVLAANGSGLGSDVLSGLDWVLQLEPGVSVVNLSLGAGLYPGDCDTTDAISMAFASAVNPLYDAGILTVAGTGNNGSGTGINAPACVQKAVSVGAVWDANVGSQTWYGCTDATTTADQVACWSNSSPTTDVFAPGGLMTSSLLGGTTVTLPGTSFATPIVSACAATLRAAHPTASLVQISNALRTSPVGVVDATNGLSYPRLDCSAGDAYLLGPSATSGSDGARPWLAMMIGIAGLAPLVSHRARRGRVR